MGNSAGATTMRKSSEVWPDIGAKLMSFVILDRDDDCWGWSGRLERDGYARIKWDGKMYMAHRVSWEVHKGPIPEGLDILHTCDERWCCNPDHLFPGTTQDNTADMWRKGRAAPQDGENNGYAQLNRDEVRQIRRLLAEGRHTQEEIGRMFWVGRGAVKSIKRGETWAWLE
jgi:hypothetical protein